MFNRKKAVLKPDKNVIYKTLSATALLTKHTNLFKRERERKRKIGRVPFVEADWLVRQLEGIGRGKWILMKGLVFETLCT